METEIKDIYAVGDAVQVKHYITGKPTLIPLAGPQISKVELPIISWLRGSL